MMNPYSPPESELGHPVGQTPLLIKITVGILILSVLLMLISSYLASLALGGGFFDPVGIGLNMLWIGIIAWICNDLLRSKNNPRFTMLILCGIVVFFALDEPVNTLIMTLDLIEAFCYLVCFFILNLKSIQFWFTKSQ